MPDITSILTGLQDIALADEAAGTLRRSNRTGRDLAALLAERGVSTKPKDYRDYSRIYNSIRWIASGRFPA